MTMPRRVKRVEIDWPLPAEMSRAEFIELWRKRDALEERPKVGLQWDAKQGRMVLRNHRH
jgi:hypothetical protein